MDGPGSQIKEQAEAVRAHPEVAAGLARLIDQLCDIGDGRIANMDAAGIDVQVLSLTAPGVEQFSTDYPYSSMTEACTFLDQLPVSPADKERIAHGNAERLLRL